MDHYSLEVLGKLHHQELVREGVHSQAARRADSRKYLSKHWKWILFVAEVTLLMCFYFF
jgi:hypothetical protein